MRRFAFALALPLLAGCTTTPMASYVSVTDAGDVTGVVPTIAGYVSDTLPSSSKVLVEAPASGGWDPVTPALIANLHSRGFAIADAQQLVEHQPLPGHGVLVHRLGSVDAVERRQIGRAHV